jgi:hypothetical protein
MVFASTVLVIWAVAYVPYALRQRNHVALFSSALVMSGIYIHLCWEIRPFPYNVLGALAVFALALGGGFLQHHQNQKHREE